METWETTDLKKTWEPRLQIYTEVTIVNVHKVRIETSIILAGVKGFAYEPVGSAFPNVDCAQVP